MPPPGGLRGARSSLLAELSGPLAGVRTPRSALPARLPAASARGPRLRDRVASARPGPPESPTKGLVALLAPAPFVPPKVSLKRADSRQGWRACFATQFYDDCGVRFLALRLKKKKSIGRLLGHPYFQEKQILKSPHFFIEEVYTSFNTRS